jgi:hypothetical protein
MKEAAEELAMLRLYFTELPSLNSSDESKVVQNPAEEFLKKQLLPSC